MGNDVKQEHAVESFTLQNDVGSDFSFTGRLFSEASFFDEESGGITRMKLFVTSDSRMVYHIVSGAGEEKSRRLYVLQSENGLCRINNGRHDFTLPADMLFAAVFGLCRINPDQAEDLRESMDECLKAANI